LKLAGQYRPQLRAALPHVQLVNDGIAAPEADLFAALSLAAGRV